MTSPATHRPLILLVLLSICLLFLGVNGIVGGYLMLSDPFGAPMGMSVSVLERTPFQNFIIPGICLLFIWGAGSFLALIGLWVRPQRPTLNVVTRWTHEYWAWTLTVALGLALIVWLTFQLFTLPAVAPIQFILFGLAVLLAGIPLFPGMRESYRL